MVGGELRCCTKVRRLPRERCAGRVVMVVACGGLRTGVKGRQPGGKPSSSSSSSSDVEGRVKTTGRLMTREAQVAGEPRRPELACVNAG